MTRTPMQFVSVLVWMPRGLLSVGFDAVTSIAKEIVHQLFPYKISK
jgi:hypothetical protein